MQQLTKIQKIIIGAIATVILLIGGVYSYHNHVISTENNRQVVTIDRNAPSVVFFYKDTCPDCQKVFLQVMLNKDFKAKNIQFVNLNNQANRHYIIEYGLKTVPTFVVLKNGREVRRYAGTKHIEIKQIFNELNGHEVTQA